VIQTGIVNIDKYAKGILYMKISEILVESASADLYHGTTLSKAEQIISSDKMIANTRTHNPKLFNGTNPKTISFSRNLETAKTFTQDENRTGEPGVILVFDHAKLKRDFGNKLQPYDDTSTDWYADQLKANAWHGNYTAPSSSARARNKSESEEVLPQNIDNVNKYIKKIYILYYPRSGTGPYSSEYKETEESRRAAARITKSPLIRDPRTVMNDQGTRKHAKANADWVDQEMKNQADNSVNHNQKKLDVDPPLSPRSSYGSR
jgi:hypothetical protein